MDHALTKFRNKMIEKKEQINILLIEDNPGDVRLTQEAFKEGELNVNLEIAIDGVEALNFLHKSNGYEDAVRPDLILLDLNLPKRDGREVLAEIKVNDDLKKIPVVILTTSDAEQDVIKSYNLHANCYINKPVDFDKFFKVIRQIEQFWLEMVILPTFVKYS